MHKVTIPELEIFIGEEGVEHRPYAYSKTLARFDPLVVPQTAGSTGTPKAIVMKQGTMAAMDTHHRLPAIGVRETVCNLFQGCIWLNGFPFYHTGAYLFLLGYAIYSDITTVLPPAVPFTADVVDQMHSLGECNAAILPPSLIADLRLIESARTRLSGMKSVAYAGGPLPRASGDEISSLVKVVNLLGSTETAMYPVVVHDLDWEYVKYSPLLGHELRHFAEELYELVIVRKPDFDLFQDIFCTYPEIEEYHTKELYQQHPTLKQMWKNVGRTDDILAFSNAEELNPVDCEKIVTGRPSVRACLYTGQARFQAALIVEPRQSVSSAEEKIDLLDKIWPTIVYANSQCVGAGRISRELVLFTHQSKPLPKTERGTIRRMLAAEPYKEELDRLYSALDQRTPPSESRSSPPKQLTREELNNFVVGLVSSKARSPQIDDVQKFTQIGLDSIHFSEMTREINSSIQSREPGHEPIAVALLYFNRSIGQFLNVLIHILEQERVKVAAANHLTVNATREQGSSNGTAAKDTSGTVEAS